MMQFSLHHKWNVDSCMHGRILILTINDTIDRVLMMVLEDMEQAKLSGIITVWNS